MPVPDESKRNISSSQKEQDLDFENSEFEDSEFEDPEFEDSEYADSEFCSDLDDEIMPKTAQFHYENKLSRNDTKLSSNKNKGIIVCSTTNSKEARHYDKKYNCFYWGNLFSKLQRHLESKHSDEADVAQIMALKDDKSKEA